MRALLALMALAPTFAVAQPCEELITAICPDTVKRAKCVGFVAERIVVAKEKTLAPEERAKWCADTLADQGAVDEFAARVKARAKAKAKARAKAKAKARARLPARSTAP